MRTIDLTTWREFPQTIDKIRKEFGEYKIDGLENTFKNRILYRGQTDSQWSLDTTLERVSKRVWTVFDYARVVLQCAPRIETFTEKEWNITRQEELESCLKKHGNDILLYIPDYAFWVYLRHHGFPSPLLDWTASPLVAAFFAFADQSDVERASIFAFIERQKGVKGGWVGAPEIRVCGPYVRTHKRHFLQQAWYTVCTSLKEDQHHFCPHDTVVERADNDQDILIKITVPRSERRDVIATLNESNINYFTLFQSDEALMRTLAMEEIEGIRL
jgi:hypothetical protein